MPQGTVKSVDTNAATALVTTSEVVEAPFTGVVTEVTYTPVANVTGAASPASRTLTLVNHKQDGSGTTAIATLALASGTNLTAFDEKAFTLSVTASDLQVAAGDELEVKSAPVGGTGLADPGGTVNVAFGRNN